MKFTRSWNDVWGRFEWHKPKVFGHNYGVLVASARIHPQWSKLAGRTIWQATIYFGVPVTLSFSSLKRVEAAIQLVHEGE